MRFYREIEIKPHGYEMNEELGIPQPPTRHTFLSQSKVAHQKGLMKASGELYNSLPDKLKDAIDLKSGNCIWGSMEKRLNFIVIPDPGKLSTAHCLVAEYKDRLARIIFLKENGLDLEQIRILFWTITDTRFAIDLQFLKDNGIDIKNL